MLKGKCALITGSTAGLGLVAARRFAAEGCNVVLNGLAPPEDMAPILRQLEADHGIRALFHGANLAHPGQIEELISTATATFGGVDILVNNAVVRHFSPVETFAVERWDEALAVNLSAAFHTVRLVLPGMRRRNWGRIINMSSVYGLFATTNRIDYVTTKTALIGLTRAVALETQGCDITCNALCPGSVLTPYSDGKIATMMAARGIAREQAVREFLSARQPAGRFVEADSVAAMMVFLCSPAGRDITAAALPMDIGWHAV